MAVLVIVALVAACVLLAPSIVLGYAVKAAEREDRERASEPCGVYPPSGRLIALVTIG